MKMVQHQLLLKVYWQHHFPLFLLSDVAPVLPSAGGRGRLLERADWWMSESADLSPAAGGRDQSAEAVQLQAER